MKERYLGGKTLVDIISIKYFNSMSWFRLHCNYKLKRSITMTFVIDVNRYTKLIILVIIKQQCSVSGGCYISARQNVLIFLKISFRTQSLITDKVIKTLNSQSLSKMFYWYKKDQMLKVSLKCCKLLVTLFIYCTTNWQILP